MIKKSVIQCDNVTHCSISILWEIDPQIGLSKIVLRLKKHSVPPEDFGLLEISANAIGYDFISLDPLTLYEIQIAPCDNKRQYSWSNLLICRTLKPPTYELFYSSEKLLTDLELEKKEIIDARNLKDWKEYVNCSYKFAKPKEIRNEIFKRTLVWADAVERFEDDYYLDRPYFQGPFVVRPK